MSHCYGCDEHDAHCTCFKKVEKVGPFSDEPVMYGTPWGDLVPASALAAEQAKVRELVEVLENVQEADTAGATPKMVQDVRAEVRAAIAKYGEQK